MPYKHIELAIEAARSAKRKLVVIGGGPLLEPLRRASPETEFLGRVDRSVIVDRLRRARSLILPGIEDFGITPLEAMALGTPVVVTPQVGVASLVARTESGLVAASNEEFASALRRLVDD